MSEKFVQSGLQFQRLGQVRVELSAGAAGSVDSITIGGTELLSGAVAFNTSLLQTAIDVADDINAGTNTHGYQATAGTPDTNAEVLIYQVIPGAVASPAVVVGVTTITAAVVVPTGATAGEVYGDTDSFVNLEDFAAIDADDDYAIRGLLRVDPSPQVKAPRELISRGGTPCVFVENGVVEGNTTRYKMTNTETSGASTKPEADFKLFETTALRLPIRNWQKGDWRGVVQCDIDAVFDPEYLLLV